MKFHISKTAGDYFFRAEAFGNLVAHYRTPESTLIIDADLPAMGIYKAIDVPYLYDAYKGCAGLIIYADRPEIGFYKAVQHNNCGRCGGCMWATGESCLPCTVNPMDYGQGCREYEAN